MTGRIILAYLSVCLSVSVCLCVCVSLCVIMHYLMHRRVLQLNYECKFYNYFLCVYAAASLCPLLTLLLPLVLIDTLHVVLLQFAGVFHARAN